MEDFAGYMTHSEPKYQRKTRQSRTRAVRLEPTEYEIHTALMKIVYRHEKQYPALKAIHHSPNGGHRPSVDSNGRRYSPEGQRMRAQGTRPGFPDLFWMRPRRQYIGLAIELKSKTGRLSEAQAWWRNWCISQGCRWELCRSADEAWSVILEYLECGKREVE